ncbi:MAG: GntR family transcriptional regulator, partial [Acetobacteraceae bacterium]|nr:GntR family transcriptional regulator [Acetobacteraceae bacterium]
MPSDMLTEDPPVTGDKTAATPAPRPVSSPDQVVSEILRGLYTGRYVPGQRLIEADLTREYKVSRGSIREALKRLAAEGVVSLNLYRGAYIRTLSRSEARDVFAVTEVLTGLAARLAAERIREGDNEALVREAVADVVATARGDFIEFAQARNRFYRRSVRVGGNRELD